MWTNQLVNGDALSARNRWSTTRVCCWGPVVFNNFISDRRGDKERFWHTCRQQRNGDAAGRAHCALQERLQIIMHVCDEWCAPLSIKRGMKIFHMEIEKISKAIQTGLANEMQQWWLKAQRNSAQSQSKNSLFRVTKMHAEIKNHF